MTRRCTFFLFLLIRSCGSESFQDTTAEPALVERQLQGSGYNPNYYTNGNYNNAARQSGGLVNNADDDDSFYNYPGQGSASASQNAAYVSTSTALAGFVPPTSSEVFEITTTGRFRGSMVASSGSDPFDDPIMRMRESSLGSSSGMKESSSGSFKTRMSQWSSSGSDSGSGWLWPWDYENVPWELPYWQWWQYVMFILCSCCFCICFGFCMAHCCHCGGGGRPARKERKHKHKHHHHHHRHHDEPVDEESGEESDYSDSSEDLESDPSRRALSRSQASLDGPRGYAPSRGYNPQHRY